MRSFRSWSSSARYDASSLRLHRCVIGRQMSTIAQPREDQPVSTDSLERTLRRKPHFSNILTDGPASEACPLLRIFGALSGSHLRKVVNEVALINPYTQEFPMNLPLTSRR